VLGQRRGAGSRGAGPKEEERRKGKEGKEKRRTGKKKRKRKEKKDLEELEEILGKIRRKEKRDFCGVFRFFGCLA
jgi:hypothetical protein